MSSMGLRDVDRAVWTAASDIAEAVNDASCAGQLGQIVMDALHRMVGVDLGSILTVAPGEEWAIAGEIADNRPLQRNYWRYTHEMRPDEVQRLSGRFASVLEIFGPRRRETLGVFREFLTPQGLGDVVVRNWFVDGRVYGLGLARQRPTFTERDRARLVALFPHMKAALRAEAWLNDRRDDHPAAGDGGAWGLTPAQERTMSLTVRGLTNQEVAGLLGTSPNTVRNTLVEVFKKVGVSRRSELAFIVRGGGRSHRSSAAALARERSFVAAVETNNSRAARR